MITTDYTAKKNVDTLQYAALTRYRLTHWLVDILKNFFSDPINIKDERLQGLLKMHDGLDETYLNALFRIEPPFTTSSIKACTTPAIMVTAGEMQYPAKPVNAGVGVVQGAIEAQAMYARSMPRTCTATVAVITESCDGTTLLASQIEDFLLFNAVNFQAEGMIHQFSVQGSSAPQRIASDQTGNAKDLYQVTIQIQVTGSVRWTVDTQGPTYRGLTT